MLALLQFWPVHQGVRSQLAPLRIFCIGVAIDLRPLGRDFRDSDLHRVSADCPIKGLCTSKYRVRRSRQLAPSVATN